MRSAPSAHRSVWSRFPITARAIVVGLAMGLSAANVWPLLVLTLPTPLAAFCELAFLAAYVIWARGRFWPRSTKDARASASRSVPVSAAQWTWGLLAGLAIAVAVHAAIFILFRLVPFPAAAFHAGYDFSRFPTLPLRWLACVISALSAGICEEMGFRGYMQRPIERQHGPVLAIAVSSLMFMLLHLNKDWSVIGMTPIVLGAGVMFGILAWVSRSLVFCMLGHWVMDISLFAYWWTQIAGVFHERPIFETGIDLYFMIGILVSGTAIGIFTIFCRRLRAPKLALAVRRFPRKPGL